MNTSLLLVHGNGGGGFRFSRCLPYFTGVVAAPTLPGFHPLPRDPELRTIADYANRLLPYLEAMPRPRAVLGTGIGGSLLLELLQRHCDKVDLVILHAPVGAHLDRRLFPRLMRLPGVCRTARFLLGWPPLRPLWTRLFFETPLEREFLNQFFDGYRNCEAFGEMFNLIDLPWWESLRPVEIPAVVLWGGRERLLTPDQQAAFGSVLPLARMQIINDWRHFPMVEQPEEFAAVVQGLLEEN